jgi:hypothetical protein
MSGSNQYQAIVIGSVQVGTPLCRTLAEAVFRLLSNQGAT